MRKSGAEYHLGPLATPHRLAANVCLGAARHPEADRWLAATRGPSVYGREDA